MPPSGPVMAYGTAAAQPSPMQSPAGKLAGQLNSMSLLPVSGGGSPNGFFGGGGAGAAAAMSSASTPSPSSGSGGGGSLLYPSNALAMMLPPRGSPGSGGGSTPPGPALTHPAARRRIDGALAGAGQGVAAAQHMLVSGSASPAADSAVLSQHHQQPSPFMSTVGGKPPLAPSASQAQQLVPAGMAGGGVVSVASMDHHNTCHIDGLCITPPPPCPSPAVHNMVTPGSGGKSIASTPTKLDTEQLTPTKKAKVEVD